jgi:predicted metal-dependent phosphoesterase TrpH
MKKFQVKNFDLHMHSSHSSDGVLSPFQILTVARSRGINLFSITDHNTVAGAFDMKWYEGRYGGNTMFVNGVELSTYHGDREIHVCAYGVDPSSNVLAGILETYKRNRDVQAQKRADKLQDLGFNIDYEDVVKEAKGKTASGVTFLKVLLKDHKNKSKLQDYISGEKSVSPYTNFYFDYFTKGGDAWVDVRLLDFFDTVEKLKDKAVLVIAHPSLYKDREISELTIEGISGVEAYSTYHNSEKIDFYRKYASDNNLLITAGSDFHGERIKPGISIGGHGCNDLSVAEKFIEKISELPNSHLMI